MPAPRILGLRCLLLCGLSGLLTGACAPATANQGHVAPKAAKAAPTPAAKAAPPPHDPAFGVAPPATLAVGEGFVCAVRADERVACWGNNSEGQLGAGHTRTTDGPQLVRELHHVVEVAAGENHACARQSEGAVWCWGSGEDFRLGSAQEPGAYIPQRVPHVAHAVALGVGDRHSCAILKSGGVRCWGDPGDGRLGLDHLDHVTEPANVALDVEGATGLALGGASTCVRDGHGRVHCWGFGPTNDANQKQTLPELTDVVKLTSAGDFCAWNKGGDITCFNSRGPAEERTHQPDNTTHLARADYDAWCALAGEALSCWGTVTDPHHSTDESLNELHGFDELPRAKEVRARHDTICARAVDDAVFCWGNNAHGQLGRPQGGVYAKPVAVPVPGPVVALDIVDHNSCALARDGRIRCWGHAPPTSWPSQSNVSNATSFALGRQSCALHDGGLVACWGALAGSMGELGSGPAPKPTKPSARSSGILSMLGVSYVGQHVDAVQGLPKATAVAVARGRSCALGASGVWCWGDTDPTRRGTNHFGGPCSSFGGDGKLCDHLKKPVLVPTSQGATALRGSEEAMCMIRADRSVACWDNLTPHTIVGLSGAVSLHAGTNEICAIDASGALSCWNREASVVANTPYTEPLVAWSGGDDVECAVTQAGSVLCMGRGKEGQLGDGRREDSPASPRKVASITHAISVRVGASHACALLRDGTVQCWGSGDLNMARADTTLAQSGVPLEVDVASAR